MTEDASKANESGKPPGANEPGTLEEHRRKQYFDEIERCMLSLRPLAGVSGKVTATPLFAFVALLSQDVQGRLSSLKQSRDEVRAAVAAEKDGLLRMLEEERRTKAVTGMNSTPQALTASVATVSLVSMLKQLDNAISNEMQALASWLVQIVGMCVLAMVESSGGDGSEIPALAAQVDAQSSMNNMPTTLSRLESILGPLSHSSPIVQHAAGTLISTCVAIANASKGRAAPSFVPANDALLVAAQTLAGKAGNGCPLPAPNGQLPVIQQHYTMEELQLLLSCMHPAAPAAAAV